MNLEESRHSLGAVISSLVRQNQSLSDVLEMISHVELSSGISVTFGTNNQLISMIVNDGREGLPFYRLMAKEVLELFVQDFGSTDQKDGNDSQLSMSGLESETSSESWSLKEDFEGTPTSPRSLPKPKKIISPNAPIKDMGIPQQLTSMQSTQFSSKLVQSVCKKMTQKIIREIKAHQGIKEAILIDFDDSQLEYGLFANLQLLISTGTDLMSQLLDQPRMIKLSSKEYSVHVIRIPSEKFNRDNIPALIATCYKQYDSNLIEKFLERKIELLQKIHQFSVFYSG